MAKVRKPDMVRRTGDAVRCVVCTVKNEGPFLLEWLAYHRLIGFNRFVMFSNDCTDGTHEMLQALDAAGLIHHFDNSILSDDLPSDPQGRAYTRANTMEVVRESDWIMVLDGDEFLNVKTGDGTLDALFAAVPNGTDAIGIQWRVFGAGGVVPLTDGLQIDLFRRAAPLDYALSTNHLAIKTLFRPDLVQRFGIHRPVYKGTSGTSRNPVLFVNGSGIDITADFLRGRWCTTPANAGYDLAQVNHYMIRAHDVFLMKKWRGTANSSNADRINFNYFDKYNNSHDRDDGIAGWVGRVQAEIDALKAQVQGLAALQDAAFAAYGDQISTLKARLKSESPQEYKRLFDEPTVAAELAAQEAALARLRARHGEDGKIRMFPHAAEGAAAGGMAARAQPTQARRAAPPAGTGGRQRPGATAASAPAAPLTRHKNADEEALNDDDMSKAPAVVAAPGWLTDLRAGPHRRGFYQSFNNYAANFSERSPDHLVVSFDNLSSVRGDPVDRESWGYGFIRKNGWSHLGVMAFQPTWFRDDELFDYMRGLADRGFFAGFKSVTMIGTSMGAYAATAFATLAPGCSVVAFSPQSTLKKSLVPWEKRFKPGRRADWTGDFADASTEARAAGRVWLIYDPLFEEDRLHADRYDGANIMRLRARYAGHKTALFLRRAGLLSTVVREAVAGRLDETRFYELYRTGRALPWYLNGVAARIAASNRPDRLHLYRDILNNLGKPQIARLLSDRFPEIMSS